MPLALEGAYRCSQKAEHTHFRGEAEASTQNQGAGVCFLHMQVKNANGLNFHEAFGWTFAALGVMVYWAG
jgi:hypothetical protein